MTAEEKDKEWRNALECYGWKVTGTPEEVVRKMMQEYQKLDWHWQEEIAKYLPQIGVMSFSGPSYTIKWLMDRVDIKSKKEYGVEDAQQPSRRYLKQDLRNETNGRNI